MNIELKIKKVCSHCKNNAIQKYLIHHVYDEDQGGLWDGEVETARKLGTYFVFSCETCEEVLLYHMYLDDEAEDFLSYIESHGKVHPAWNEAEIRHAIELVWPKLYEDIHEYVPAPVRKCYLKALRNIRSPQLFAIEIRKAIEAICNERGIGDKDDTGRHRGLGDRVNELCKISMLPNPVREIAHKIIKTGNDAAHSSINPKAVPLVRNFFQLLVNHIYVLPMQIPEWESLRLDVN